MHERDFKVTTTNPFSCMIFCLCKSVGVPIWHIDQLKTPLGTVDTGLIRDEANVLAPRRGTLPELPPLGKNMADTVEQARMATQAPSETTDTTLVESSWVEVQPLATPLLSLIPFSCSGATC